MTFGTSNMEKGSSKPGSHREISLRGHHHHIAYYGGNGGLVLHLSKQPEESFESLQASAALEQFHVGGTLRAYLFLEIYRCAGLVGQAADRHCAES